MAFTFVSGGSAGPDFSVVEKGDSVVFSDISENDQDKTFVAPYDMEVQGVRVEYSAINAGGTRLVRIEWLLTDSDICMSRQFQATPIADDQFAFEVSSDVNYIAAVDSATYTINGFERVPPICLRKGHSLRLVASSTQSNDDMFVIIRGVAT